MGKFDELKKKKKLIVLDGPMGTELERRGYDVSDALWSAKYLAADPDAIRRIHLDYLQAGADIITCASYQASVPGLEKAGYTSLQAEALIRKSMELVKEAIRLHMEEAGSDAKNSCPLAAGDIGPYGAYLADGSEYTGNYHLTREEYRAFHFDRMRILKDAGADIFAVETCPRLDEAQACADMLEELGADYWISFTFRSPFEISDGTGVRSVTDSLTGGRYPHLKAIGVNCTPPELVGQIIRNLKAGTGLPIIVYPNSGERYDGTKKMWYGAQDHKTFVQRVPEWISEGAGIIGGCCRTVPDDIRQISEMGKNE